MRELSLFTGAGGGIWGSKLLGWQTVGYVEWDRYCQKVIRQRIEDGIFDRAPIFSDVRAFADIAGRFRGLVDVVAAGFPCQPFSAAGKKLGEADPRNMWPATLECIGKIRPDFALLENVPGLTSDPYFGRIIADLTALGFGCRWTVISAAELGAPHVRERLWILADAGGFRGRQGRNDGRARGKNAEQVHAIGVRQVGNVADSMCGWRGQSDPLRRSLERVDNGLQERQKNTGWAGCSGEALVDSAEHGPQRGDNENGEYAAAAGERHGKFAGSGVRSNGWWEIEPDVGRVVDGMAHRRDRLRALGNGQVPRVVQEAWERLTA